MSKTPSQEKTQQDLHKYWNSTTPKGAYREKEHPISSNIESASTSNTDTSKTPLKVMTQPISSDSDQNISLNNKKRKAPRKETTREETSSPH